LRCRIAHSVHLEVALQINITSSLDAPDEARYAHAFIKVIAAILDTLPASYAIRVEHSDGSITDQQSVPAVETAPISSVLDYRARLRPGAR
jgi:hypothetical protein